MPTRVADLRRTYANRRVVCSHTCLREYPRPSQSACGRCRSRIQAQPEKDSARAWAGLSWLRLAVPGRAVPRTPPASRLLPSTTISSLHPPSRPFCTSAFGARSMLLTHFYERSVLPSGPNLTPGRAKVGTPCKEETPDYLPNCL